MVSDAGQPCVLVLASTYPRWRGDPEPGFVHELCKRLAGRFHVIAVVPDAPGAEPSGPLDGVDVIRCRYAPQCLETLVNNGGIAANLRRARWKWILVPGFFLGQWWAARRVLQSRSVSVIHAHWLLPQGIVARALHRRFGVPYVVTSHGGDLFGLRGRVPTQLKRKVAASCATMTVVSEAMREESARIGLNPRHLEVIPMGVDLRERFVPSLRVQRKTDELLFVGRLVPKKGLRHLLDALPAVIIERPRVRLTIAGFGPEEPRLKAQAEALGITGHVTFAGATSQEDLPALYRRAALFVAPFVRDGNGDQEGLPVALMEAIGCACPALIGAVAGVDDLLGEDAAAVTVRPDDLRALAAAILAALSDPEASQKRALRLRDRVAERVDWRTIADAYAALLERCAAA